MSFGDNLQHQSSHRALLHLQDAEIQLLESMRKCIDQRIKSDRQYASALAVLVSHAQKFDSGISSPVFQAWNNIVKETQNWILLLRDHADKLSAKALETLSNIITEKKAARKFYLDEKLRLEAGLRKVKDEVTKHKQDYEKNITKHIQDRLKLEEFMAKGLPARKLEDARMKLTKSSMKLHKTHNNYVAALLEASEHERHYLGTVLPNLLNYQEEIEKLMVLQCKSVLKDYADLTDFSTPEHTAIYKRIHEQADSISPATEYKTFIEKHKSEKLQSSKLEFDSHLLTGYHGTLKENELAVDSFTLENVQQSFSKVTEQLQECQQSILSKESSLASEQEQLNNISGQEQSNKYIVSKRTVLRLERELNELRCREKVLAELKELYNRQLTKLGGRTPPLGVDLLETTSVSTSNYEGADSAVDGTKGQSKLNVVLHKLKKPSPVPPPPPEKDFIPDATNGNDGARISNSSSQHPPVSVMRQAHGPACDSYQQIAVGDDSRPFPQMVSNTGRRLDDEEWFHGVLPREEVQRLLVNDGDYLVRVSKNRKTGEMQYVLSVMWNDHKHFIIQGQEGAWRFEADQYPTIQELIINQHNSGVPVTRKSGAILKNPVLRETWELKNDDILLGQKIGNGNFGDVFKGTYRPTNQEVAVKTCRETLSEDAKKKFLQEGRILKQYEHPNIVKFIGIAAHRHPVMIVMEYVPGGSLLNFLKKQGKQQSKTQLIKMCQGAAAGMAYLESRSCIHRDLAARNCLVGKRNIVKISDFGMSREEEEYTVSGGLKQIPIKWTAPEALNYGTYTSACDVWSFGVLMWEVFSFGQSPYPGLTNSQAREKVDDGYRMPRPDYMPEAVYSLTMKCWFQEPKERPHFSEIDAELQKILQSM